MRRCALLLPALLSLAFAPAPFARPVKKEAVPTIEGKWTQVGKPSVTLIVTRESLEFHNEGGNVNAYRLTYNSASAPKSYELRRRDGESLFIGIYRVEGDLLTLCDRANGPRPLTFDEPHTAIDVFKRLK
jgi:uncharacterized protein (TIGR03067 family)